MEVIQARLPKGLIDELNRIVNKGIYTNKSDLIRDAIRRLILEKQIGSVSNKSNSVKQVRSIRNKLSKEKFNLKEINNIN